MQETKPATARVIAAAAAEGLDIAVTTFPEGTRTAADAAAAIGCDVAAIVKSIVMHDDVGPLLVLVSGRHRVDAGKVEAELGGGVVRRATADEARAATGYAIGGTAPFGHPAPLRMLLDRDLLQFEEVWAAAGTPDTVFPLTPQQLMAATGVEPADVAE
ncbi:YbaK/EbsC family protein [Euzebya rosea]|uniref:YbaK/EbsC family protein n=1 Tax=Euzebya rosea TaxID=2052804 RepID=UPI000D3ED96B|nr:YbaK/EbsC family protein [Euzebya rosea]